MLSRHRWFLLGLLSALVLGTRGSGGLLGAANLEPQGLQLYASAQLRIDLVSGGS